MGARIGKRAAAEAVEWLRATPTLDDLVSAYPNEWGLVQRDVAALVEHGDGAEIKAYVARISRQTTPTGDRVRPRADRISAEIRRQMTIHVLKQAILSASTGVSEGRVRFGLAAGYLAQRLLFRRQLHRKPVSLRAFRALWPLLGRQRRLLMPLVRPKGIWCFYSRPLIARLTTLIGDRTCLEIAAGDGTLSAFLAGAGADITATDDHSWSDSITYPDAVLQQDARTALRAHQPQVVVCSWPPAGNEFERHVFATPSVQLYVVIGSPHEHTTGNWAAYRAQTEFDLSVSPELGRLVLPPEVDHAVLLFTRKPAAS